MKLSTYAVLCLAIALTGCATIRRHPVITGAVVAIVATSIALSAGHGSSSVDPRPIPLPRQK